MSELNERLSKLIEGQGQLPLTDLHDWIAKNQSMIDTHIKKKVPNIGKKLDDEERRLWVLNDEQLYNAAKNDGVDVDG